jgi:hypothetical protein
MVEDVRSLLAFREKHGFICSNFEHLPPVYKPILPERI